MTPLERLRAATGPDRELDALIHARRMGWDLIEYYHGFASAKFLAGGSFSHAHYSHVPLYTASIDAALEYVPEGWIWCIEQEDGKPVLFTTSLYELLPGIREINFTHDTAPLAILTAAEEARVKMEREG